MIRKRIPLALWLCLCATASAFAQELPKVSRPEDSGLSSERLGRIALLFQSEIDKKAIPGAVVLVYRNGK